MLSLFKFLEKHLKISVFILLVISFIIFYVSSLSFYSLDNKELDIESVLYHFSVFFLFGLFLMICLVRGRNKELFSLAAILSLGYAVLDEFHQIFVPNRSASIGDVLVDMFGVVFAFLIYSISLNYRRIKKF